MTEVDSEPMPHRALGRLLFEASVKLVERWSRAIQRDNPLLRALPEASVINAMGLFIEQVATSLGAGRLVHDSRVAQSHGEHRQATALGVSALIGEYVTFLDVAHDVATEQGHVIEPDEMLALARCVLIGAAESTHAYATRQAREGRRRDAEQFAFLAHDLRNPLAVVRMAWHLLREQGQLPPTEPVKLIDRSLTATIERLESSLSEMRDRVELGAAVATLMPHDVGELVRAACAVVALAAHTKEVELDLEGDADLTVDVDARLISAALINVLHNAIKHGPASSKVSIRWHADQHQAVVSICDNGDGITPEVAERIYESFRAGPTATPGFGLGLAIVRQALEAHGGSVHVENRAAPDHGCCFRLVLPLAERSNAS